jgi:hypothetical protein
MALIDCAECGKPVSTQALACPHCGAPVAAAPDRPSLASSVPKRRTSSLVILLRVLFVGGVALFVGLFLVAILTSRDSTKTSPAPVGDDAAYFIWKYGPPDLDESTEHEQPRPPMVTRWLTYRNERVRMVYYPDAKPGSPPPYKGWKLMGALDLDQDQTLSPDEIVRRMAPRKRHE